MQAGPMKPTLKPPGTKRWIPVCENLLPSVAFDFYLRRYSEVWPSVTRELKAQGVACELNLVEGSMTVRLSPAMSTLCGGTWGATPV